MDQKLTNSVENGSKISGSAENGTKQRIQLKMEQK